LPANTPARVLTVEDNPIVRADLRLILEDAGFEVCADARDGVEAVELARSQRPDLILIDLNLPGVDGIEATRRILDERDVPIVALTGDRGAVVERAMEAGAVAHVLKPFQEAHLVNTITGALAERVERDEAVNNAEAERYRRLALVESMVRANYTEHEIGRALRGYYEPAYDPSRDVRFSSWIRALFGG